MAYKGKEPTAELNSTKIDFTTIIKTSTMVHMHNITESPLDNYKYRGVRYYI